MKTTLLIILLLSTFSLFAQNNNTKTSSEKFRQEREKELKKLSQEEENFKKEREQDYKNFKSDYETAFEKFKKNYGQFLDEEEEVINIMSSDDNLPIKAISLKRDYKIESSAVKEIQRINIERKNLSKLSAPVFLTTLSESTDEIKQLKDAVEKLNVANESFETTPIKNKKEEIVVPPEPIENKKEIIHSEPKETKITPSGKPTNYTRLSSTFGNRRHPINYRQSFHKGVDLTAPRMTPVKATADGIITYAKTMGGYGNFIKINHQNGYKTAYAHLHRISTKLNTEVKKGDIIGYVGSTGRSTGNHLHYEMYYKDKLIDPAKTF